VAAGGVLNIDFIASTPATSAVMAMFLACVERDVVGHVATRSRLDGAAS
jgi:hypothetical protein